MRNIINAPRTSVSQPSSNATPGPAIGPPAPAEDEGLVCPPCCVQDDLGIGVHGCPSQAQRPTEIPDIYAPSEAEVARIDPFSISHTAESPYISEMVFGLDWTIERMLEGSLSLEGSPSTHGKCDPWR